jgi:putative transcriptional regulator
VARDFRDIKMGLAEKMAGEVVLSDNPGETLKKWRKNFEISQIEIAKHLGMSPSVISDYEGGRRSSPGITLVRKIVEALLEIDEKNGGIHIRGYENILTDTRYQDIILDIREYRTPVVLEEFSNRIGAQKIAGNFERTIQGYTLVDSIKAIFELSSNEFYHLYGWSTERALIFSKVTTGRSPMVALRVTTLKPAAVVLHGITADNIDPVAKRIAEIEQVPLMVTNKPIDQMLEQIKF